LKNTEKYPPKNNKKYPPKILKIILTKKNKNPQFSPNFSKKTPQKTQKTKKKTRYAEWNADRSDPARALYETLGGGEWQWLGGSGTSGKRVSLRSFWYRLGCVAVAGWQLMCFWHGVALGVAVDGWQWYQWMRGVAAVRMVPVWLWLGCWLGHCHRQTATATFFYYKN
jgi:Flp pilus assembly protein TadB